MRQILVAGNWKMNLLQNQGVALSQALASKYASCAVEVLVCPALPYLSGIATTIRGSAVQLGAQNLYFAPQGAFTGEVCGDMLKDIGCGWVLVGHSERRQFFGEQDELLAKKVAAGLQHSLKVVLCVGELLAERQSGQTEAVLEKQMAGLAQVSAEQMANIVIAYEPVWAIGTGVTASTEQAQQAHSFLRGQLKSKYGETVASATRILYGGSVKADNALELLSQPDVDGALVGGASLKADSFIAIIEAGIQAQTRKN
ncbi:MAG: triose-phosphate isomerase [Planctomycetes bacterium]|nr:triose-phosphate isomerase [Planctomycetota bacterium]